MTKPAQIIVPHLWFDKEAVEAAKYYVSVFPDSKVKNQAIIPGTPSGDTETVSFELMGYEFMAISAGPYFTFNPSVSFLVSFDPSRDQEARAKLDEVWNKLSDGGTVLMPLDRYPYSERYGWIQDRFGVSWQLILADPGDDERPAIAPSLLFVGEQCGKAEEAVHYYLSVFNHSKIGHVVRTPEAMESDQKETVLFADFMIENQWFAAMDGPRDDQYRFNEAISFMVNCDTQEEIDSYWEKLSAVPEAEQCGWLKDRYGLSWQIVPSKMNKTLFAGTPEQIASITKAFLKMKKFDLAALRKAMEAN